VATRTPFDPNASIGRLIEAFDEILDLGIPNRLGRLVDVHHHGPLEVRHGAGYCVQTLGTSHVAGQWGSSAPVPS
jgi:hypothetical protein